jgi:hypothetical protein
MRRKCILSSPIITHNAPEYYIFINENLPNF